MTAFQRMVILTICTVNHSMSFADPLTKQHTNERLWRLLKASFPQYNRRKVFFNGYVQKCIFLCWCMTNNKDTHVEFFRFTGKLHDTLQPQEDFSEILLFDKDEGWLSNVSSISDEGDLCPIRSTIEMTNNSST